MPSQWQCPATESEEGVVSSPRPSNQLPHTPLVIPCHNLSSLALLRSSDSILPLCIDCQSPRTTALYGWLAPLLTVLRALCPLPPASPVVSSLLSLLLSTPHLHHYAPSLEFLHLHIDTFGRLFKLSLPRDFKYLMFGCLSMSCP